MYFFFLVYFYYFLICRINEVLTFCKGKRPTSNPVPRESEDDDGSDNHARYMEPRKLRFAPDADTSDDEKNEGQNSDK